jgi:hypothetical protein
MRTQFPISSLIKTLLAVACFPAASFAQLVYDWSPETTYSGEPKSIVRSLIINGQNLTSELVQSYEDLSSGTIYQNGSLPVNAGSYRATVNLPASAIALGLKNINQTFTIKPHAVNVLLNPISTKFGNTPTVAVENINILSGAGTSQLPTNWTTLQQTWKNLLVSDQQLFNFGGITSTSPVGSTGSVTVDLTNLNTTYSPNFTFSQPQSGLATVTKAVLTITAQPIFHPYASSNAPTPNYVYSGFVPGDSEATLRATGALSGDPLVVIAGVNPTTDVPGTYTGSVVATAGTLSATNYVFEFVNADFTILKGNQDTSSIPTTVQLSFRDPDFQLPSTLANSGLPLTWNLTGASGIITLNADNTLSAVALGTTSVQATQAGNNLYNAIPTFTVNVTVGQAVFDLNADFPFYRDRQYSASDVYDLSDPSNFKSTPSQYADVLGTSANFQSNFTVNVLFGLTEGIVTANGYELTQQTPGPVVVQITLVNPNFAAASTFRAIEFTVPVPTDSGTGGNGGGDPTDPNNPGNTPDDPTDPAPDPGTSVGVGATISQGISLGDNWYELDWFGVYYWDMDNNPNHIWHEDLGWLYVPDPYLTSNPVWMYSYATLPSGGELGWLFTQSTAVRFPYFGWQEPVTKESQWLWYSQRDTDTTNGRVFWHFDAFDFLIVQAK